MNKKAAMELSVTAIVILILAIVMLGLGLSFVKGMFGKATINLEEQLSKEPTPPAADANTPVTLSRESIISQAGNNEVVKASIFNPTNKDWIFRDAVTLEDALCGDNNDGVCYLDPANPKCDSKEDDSNCKKPDGSYYTCNMDSEIGEGIGCVMIVGGDVNKQKWYDDGFCDSDDPDCNCSMDKGIGIDPDCDPTEGVRLKIECSEGLALEKITNPKQVKIGTSTEFSALLRIDKKAEKGTYLCKVGVQGFVEESEKYVKDLTIEIT